MSLKSTRPLPSISAYAIQRHVPGNELNACTVFITSFMSTVPSLFMSRARAPFSDTTVGSLIHPFGYYAYLLSLSMVFFGPFFVPMPLASVLGILAYIMFLVSFLSYPVISYLLLRRNGAGWILSFICSLATIGLNVFIMSNVSEMAVVWLFGVAINMLIVYLLYSCRTEFIY